MEVTNTAAVELIRQHCVEGKSIDLAFDDVIGGEDVKDLIEVLREFAMDIFQAYDYDNWDHAGFTASDTFDSELVADVAKYYFFDSQSIEGAVGEVLGSIYDADELEMDMAGHLITVAEEIAETLGL